MSGPDDDAPARRRGAVPPPRSQAPGDAPDSVHVPRMEPPPPSLEALVQGAPRFSRREQRGNAWLLWVAVVVVAAGITFFVMR